MFYSCRKVLTTESWNMNKQMSLKFCRNSRCIHDYIRAIKLKYLFMLLKIDFISSRQPITAKFAELREIATAFFHAQNFCKLRQLRFVYLMSRQNLFKSNEKNPKFTSG